jgi:hypothetical protein
MPMPMPVARLMNIQETVGVLSSRRRKSPKLRVVNAHPDQSDQLYLPTLPIKIPTMTDMGAIVKVKAS